MLVWRKGTRVGFEKKRCAAPEKLKWPMLGGPFSIGGREGRGRRCGAYESRWNLSPTSQTCHLSIDQGVCLGIVCGGRSFLHSRYPARYYNTVQGTTCHVQVQLLVEARRSSSCSFGL